MRMSDMRASTGPVPQAAFGAENIIGTPVPRIGSTNTRPNYASSVGTGNASKWQLIGIASAFIVLGYVAWHVYLKLE
jgi:hypothetical protein